MYVQYETKARHEYIAKCKSNIEPSLEKYYFDYSESMYVLRVITILEKGKKEKGFEIALLKSSESFDQAAN